MRLPIPILLLLLSVTPALAAPVVDTLVVAPVEYQESLTEWLAYRRSQGRTILLAEAPESAEALRALVKRTAESGGLRYVVLVGDAPALGPKGLSRRAVGTVPISYAAAVMNVVWGSAPHIATDNSLADLEGDAAPELAVGRIPCHSPGELQAYLLRVLRHERSAAPPTPRVTVVASAGRFTPFLDSLIELTANQALRQLIPSDCEVAALHSSPTSIHFPVSPIRQALLAGLSQQGLAWIYLGHGSPRGLDRLVDEPGMPCMLAYEDLASLREGPCPTIAALIACDTGCIDGAEECLAERLVLCPGGPLAVIASSRMSMPYGNSVLGIEMLSCLFNQHECVGDFFAEGKRRAMKTNPELPLRAAVEQIGLGVSPTPDMLQEEVVEHVRMYNLLGDPLLRVH